jgi:hypothetical protein
MFRRFFASEIDNIGNDIALIRLPKAAITISEDHNQRVLPICMPWTTKDQVKVPNDKVSNSKTHLIAKLGIA